MKVRLHSPQHHRVMQGNAESPEGLTIRPYLVSGSTPTSGVLSLSRAASHYH